MTAPFVIEQQEPKKRPSPLEMALLGGLGASAAADYGTTLAGLKRGAHESNPILAPFTNHGPIPLAILEAGLGGLTAYSARELKKRGSKFWWVPPALGIVAHSAAALHNRRVNK